MNPLRRWGKAPPSINFKTLPVRRKKITGKKGENKSSKLNLTVPLRRGAAERKDG